MDELKQTTPHSAEEVFHEYAPRVYNLARRMLSNNDDAEDVTQDVLLQVVRKLPSFRGESAFPTWLHRVTVNAALAHRRRRAVHHERMACGPLDVVLEQQPPCGPVRRWTVGPEEAALDRETQAVIERAIDELPEDYRDVFVLADIEGLANAAIGELLGLSLPAVKSRLHRARQKLRDALAPHFEQSVSA
jgi:RNA polymerase sigma-70 factor (ECF subfamily)